MFQFWVGLGSLLIFAEFLLPGLVAVFVGLGALTVAVLMYFGFVDSISSQILVWFAASTVYTFTLRVLVVRLYPGDTKIQSVDEDEDLEGQIVTVTQTISNNAHGRIAHSDSTWQARTRKGETLEAGARARIVGRDNITLIVERES